MFSISTISYRASGVLGKLVADYLEHDGKLRDFYDHAPDRSGFRELLSKNPYRDLNRKTLHLAVEAQAQKVANTSPESLKNIALLKNEKTFTITTGHQLCLFTGPLYFIYKIISTINLAEQLKKDHSGYEFVPVYWMASEDHDFAEVNHFNAFNKKIEWSSAQKGAVGAFRTEELKQLLPAIKEVFGESENGKYLLSLFERSYLEHPTLADATRYLVNELFGRYGLVIVDGNDSALKKEFRKEFTDDIFGNSGYHSVSETISRLADLGYPIQVNPREINVFYMEGDLRARIEAKDDSFSLAGSDKKFTRAEMESLIEDRPELLSPNVTLRPLYQQKILPNLAYVGGPGELAYWLEYAPFFRKSGIMFPVLAPRNFITIADKATASKINKLGLKAEDLFKPEQQLAQEIQVRSGNTFSIEAEKEALKKLYSNLSVRLEEVDKTLVASAAAELQKSINSLEALGGKANRSLKSRSETEMAQLRSIREKLFPNSVPQERYDNFSSYYVRYGKDLIESIKRSTDPFIHAQYIFTEE